MSDPSGPAAGRRATRWLVVHPSDEMYGADRILLTTLDLLDGEVTVWLPDDVDYPDRALSRELTRRGIHWEVRPLPIARRARLTPRQAPVLAREFGSASAAIRRLRPDRVLLNTSATAPLAPATRAAGAHTTLHLHEIWGRTDRLLLTLPTRAAHRVIAVSEASRSSLPASLQRRAVVVRNGVPSAGPARAGARQHLRDAISCRDDDVVVLVASRWNAWKGHDLLLDAWSRLDRPDMHLVVLGGPPPSGPAIDVALLETRLPASAPPVSVIGAVPDARDWLDACDLIVVPSARPDPFPTIALEALAAGRGVVAFGVGGLPEIVTDGGTGRLVPAGDVTALAGALASVTRADADRWGRCGHDDWRRRFDVPRFRTDLAAALA